MTCDADRIERCWLDLRANVTRNHRCTSMKKLLAEALDYLDRVNQRRLSTAARSQ